MDDNRERYQEKWLGDFFIFVMVNVKGCELKNTRTFFILQIKKEKMATRKKVSRKKTKKRTSHNPALKLTMRRKGSRLVHGYETAARKRRKK
jgi:hypothetical protein